MENIRRDAFALARHVAPGLFLQHDQARRVRRADDLVRIVHAGAGVHVEEIAMHEDRAVRAVVRPDARLGRHVEQPQNIRILRPDRLPRPGARREDRRERGWRRGVRRAMPRLVLERPVVAVRHAFHIETHHRVAVGDVIHALAFHGRGRRHPLLGPVEIFVLMPLWHDELPEHLPVLFIEAKQHAAVAHLRRVARRAVVRAEVNAPARDDRRGMGMGPQRHAPLHIAARLQVEGIRQPALRGHHVARPRLPPLRLVRGGQAGGCEQAQQRGAAEEETRDVHKMGNGKAEG